MELEIILRNTLLVVGIITLVVLIIQLTRIGNRVNKVLDNIKVTTDGISTFTSNPDQIKENVSDLVSMTVDKTVKKEVERLKSDLTNKLVGGVMNFVSKRK